MIQTFVLERVHLSSFPWLCVRLQDITRKCPTGTNHTGGEFTVPKREFQNEGKPLVLDNIGWSRTERKSCFPMSMTSLSSSRYRKKYGGMWRRWIKRSSRNALFYYNAIYRRIRSLSLFAGRTIFHHFYSGYERTTMTCETSENTIFAGTSPCYLCCLERVAHAYIT